MRTIGRATRGSGGGLGPRLGRLLNRAAAAGGYRLHVAAANLWRDQYNPLRGLTIRRAASLLEEGERGALADIQWTYRYVEMQDATLGALIERRTSAIQQLDWDIRTRDDVPGPKAATAAAQAAALRETYEGIGNLAAALEFLALASFRGYAHLEKVWQGGRLVELAPIEQWFWVRQGTAGPWLYNPEAKFGTTRGEPVPAERLVIREVRMPIDRVGIIAYVRKGLSQKDWDAYIESYGVPAVFILMPPDVPDGKADEYLTTAEQVAGDARGVLPNGADIKTVDAGARGNNPFLEHIRYQDEQLVLRGTGGLLTMLNDATGLGSGQSASHQKTFEAIARAEAAEISEVLRRAIDREVLARVTPGEPAWAYFDLAAREEMDSAAVVRDVAILARAGFAVSAEWVQEKTGYELAPAAPVPDAAERPGEPPEIRNREETPAETPEEGALAKLLSAALASDLHGAGKGLAETMQEELAGAVAEEVEEEAEEEMEDPDLQNTEPSDGVWRIVKGRRVFIRNPRRITAGKADGMLERGFTVRSKTGDHVRFGMELKAKLDAQPDGTARKELLEFARETVRAGEVKQVDVGGEIRTVYGKVWLVDEKGKGMLVIVDATGGYAFNYYPARAGKVARMFNRGDLLESGEQPPVEVLNAYSPLLAASWIEETVT